MNRLFGMLVVVAGVVVAASSSAMATLIYSESFSYSNGNLVPNGGWAAHAGSGSNPVQIVGGAAVLTHSNAVREDVNKSLGGPIGAGTKIFSAFDVNVASNTGSDYFAHFLQGTSTFRSRIYTTTPTTSGFRFGIGWSSAASLDATWATDLSFGTTYRIVTAYNFDNGNQQLWVSPTLETDTNLSGGTVSGLAVAAYAFRQGTLTNASQTIDNLCVGTTFNDVINCVPEPGTLALVGIGALALIRRRH